MVYRRIIRKAALHLLASNTTLGNNFDVELPEDDVSETGSCGAAEPTDAQMGLRVASIFVILIGATLGTLFPIVAKRMKAFSSRPVIFEFAKYFGSGVIIATAFIHLLAPALEALGSECLSPAWGDYPYALALALLSIFMIFIVEVIAFRWGTAKLRTLGIVHDAHGHGVGSHAAHGPEGAHVLTPHANSDERLGDIEKAKYFGNAQASSVSDHGSAQLIGIAILEFGVLFHSILIGLTLAVTAAEEFTILFVVLVFHQTFEGLGLGSRLAFAPLPPKYKWAPYVAAIVYGVSTPIGIAVGLGVRNTYAPESATASIVSGVLDSLSAGILIYTALVELIAHEFLFNPDMLHASNGKITFAIGSMLLGCGLMALLGRWA